MAFSSTCRQLLPDDHAHAVTLHYRDLAPILDAGYRRSLIDAVGRGAHNDEPAHFAVLKTINECAAVRPFLGPFRNHWLKTFSTIHPTVVIVGMRLDPKQDIETISQTLHNDCAAIITEMQQCANSQNLATRGFIHHPTTLARSCPIQDVRDRLHIPPTFLPLGAFGAAYTQNHDR